MKGLAYICQRCGNVGGEPHDDPEVALRRTVEANHIHTFHRCAHDGGTGICRLVGTPSEARDIVGTRPALTIPASRCEPRDAGRRLTPQDGLALADRLRRES